MHKIKKQTYEYVIYCCSKNLSKKTIMSYEQTLGLFVRYLKDKKKIEDVEDVTEAIIREYISDIITRGKYTVAADKNSYKSNNPEARKDYKKKVSITTINNYVRNIRAFFNYLLKQEIISKDVFKNIKLIKNERKPKEFLTDIQFKELLRCIDTTVKFEYRDYICIQLLFDTGMRIGECLNIKVKNIDMEERAIMLPREDTKGDKTRYVYFSQTMAKELRRWLQFKDRYYNSEYLFCSIKSNILSINSFESNLREYALRAGIKNIHPHQLRNNFAKRFLMAGGNIYTLSKILGHSSVTVTENSYLDLSDSDIKKTYEQFSPLQNIKKK